MTKLKKLYFPVFSYATHNLESTESAPTYKEEIYGNGHPTPEEAWEEGASHLLKFPDGERVERIYWFLVIRKFDNQVDLRYVKE